MIANDQSGSQTENNWSATFSETVSFKVLSFSCFNNDSLS